MLDEFAATAFYVGDYHNGHMACQFLSQKFDIIPESEHNRIKENTASYAQQLNQIEMQKQAEMNQQREAEKALKELKKTQEKKSTKISSRRTKAHK